MNTVQLIQEELSKKNTSPSKMMKELGFSSGLFSQWKNGLQKPSMEKLQKIADYLGVSLDYLQGRNSTVSIETLPSSNIRMIPLFESVSAGFGAYADSCVIGYEPVYIENEYEAENTLAIKVKGNSMYPKIEDGDIVVVCKDMDYEDGAIVVALIDGDDGVVKKIKRSQNSIILESINPEYMPRVFEGKDMNRINIVGVVRKIVKSV